MAGFKPDLLEIRKHRIEVRTLDGYDFVPDIIKIDVQGHEEAVVKGGIETIARSLPVLIIEDPTPGLIAFLADIGLQHYGLVDGKLAPNDLSQPNSLFLSDARRHQIERRRPAPPKPVRPSPSVAALAIDPDRPRSRDRSQG